MASSLLRTLVRSSAVAASSTARRFSGVSTQINKRSLISEHTAKWLQDIGKNHQWSLINEVPPIKVEGRIVACEGGSNPALGHLIEFICLDRVCTMFEPAVCKYCGLHYVEDHHHH